MRIAFLCELFSTEFVGFSLKSALFNSALEDLSNPYANRGSPALGITFECLDVSWDQRMLSISLA